MCFGVFVPMVAIAVAIVLSWNRYVFPLDIALLLGLWVPTSLGVTIGYHRMLTHKGFNAPEWLRGLLLILGCMAFVGSRPDSWAATHLKHHAHSDEDHDPHSPLEGFWHAHFGWLFSLHNYGEVHEYAPHLLEDKTVMFVSRYSLLWGFLAFAIPFAIGGWTGLLWGGFVRLFVTTHTTWSVNSICHTFGQRDYETTDESRNHWIVGLLAFGEGWHNNHHAFPESAFHGLRWWQFDLSGILIRLAERLGLVSAVQRVPPETMEAQKIQLKTARQKAADMRVALAERLASADEELRGFFSGIIATAVDDVERAAVLAVHSDAAVRIASIRAQINRTTNIKRQRLAVLSHEFQQTMQSAKEGAMQKVQQMRMKTV
jgi:stearoyl-CoA desaturase (delta-9 desaturase)